MQIQDYLNNGIGRKLTFLGRAADMLSITLGRTDEFDDEYAVHIMSDAAIFYRGKRYTGTDEMLFFGQDPVKSLFDEKVSALTKEQSFVLQEIVCHANRTLSLTFDHELVILSLVEEGVGEDEELWRIFHPRSEEAHLVATQSGVGFDI